MAARPDPAGRPLDHPHRHGAVWSEPDGHAGTCGTAHRDGPNGLCSPWSAVDAVSMPKSSARRRVAGLLVAGAVALGGWTWSRPADQLVHAASPAAAEHVAGVSVELVAADDDHPARADHDGLAPTTTVATTTTRPPTTTLAPTTTRPAPTTVAPTTTAAPADDRGAQRWAARLDGRRPPRPRADTRRATGTTCGGIPYPAVPALALQSQLAAAADGHARDMATNGFGHDGSNGSDIGSRATAMGYAWGWRWRRTSPPARPPPPR